MTEAKPTLRQALADKRMLVILLMSFGSGLPFNLTSSTMQAWLADAHVAIEGSRSVALHAAWAVDAKAPSKEAWDKEKDFYLGSVRAAKAHDALVAYVKRLQGQLAADAKFTKELVDDKASKGGDTGPVPSDDDGE